MTAQIKQFPLQKVLECNPLERDVHDLFSGDKQGHMNKWSFDLPKFKGDHVRGSELWDRVYNSCEYYLPEYDLKILQDLHRSLANDSSLSIFLRSVETVYDLGPGSEACVKNKLLPILNYIRPDATYAPVDLCDDFLETSLSVVGRIFPKFHLKPCVEDFDNPNFYNSKSGLITFFGSTIGNVPCRLDGPFPHDEYKKFFDIFKRYIKDGFLIISHDITQDPDLILSAYTCPEFIAFAENLPFRFARDLDIIGDFSPSSWKYDPVWRQENYQFAHRLVATENQTFKIGDKSYRFKKGQSFVSINSFKFPPQIMTVLAERAGYKTIKTLQNDRAALHVLWRRPE